MQFNVMDSGKQKRNYISPARNSSVQNLSSMDAGADAKVDKMERADGAVLAYERGPPGLVRTRSGTMLQKLTAANLEPSERSTFATWGEPTGWKSMMRTHGGHGTAGKEASKKGRGMGLLSSSGSGDWGRRSSKYLGVFYLVCGALLYSVMRLLVKILAVKSIPSFETIMFRSLMVAAAALVCCVHRGDNPFGRKAVRHLLLARAFVGYLSISSFFYSIQRLPLRDASILNFTMPVFTAILGRVFLREPWQLREAFGSLLSLVGVVLITGPSSLFSADVYGGATFTSGRKTGAADDPIGVAVGLLGSLAGAGAYIILRRVGKLQEPPMVVVFVFASLSIPLSAVCMLMSQTYVAPTAVDMVALVAVGLAAFGAQVFVTRGLQLEKASRAASMQYVSVVATYLMSLVFLKEIPTPRGALGATLVLLSAGLVILKAT